MKSARLMRRESVIFIVFPSFLKAPPSKARAVVVPRDADGVCDHNDDPEDEPAFLSPSTLPLSHISTVQTPNHHVINVQRHNQFAMLGEHLS